MSGEESLKSPSNQGRIYGEGWGMFFSKAALKCLPRPFNAAGWICSKSIPTHGATNGPLYWFFFPSFFDLFKARSDAPSFPKAPILYIELGSSSCEHLDKSCQRFIGCNK